MKVEYPCPCCGFLVFDEPPGSYAICPICFWEDDVSQLRFPCTTGANQVSLIEAQENYVKDGVCELKFRSNVRAPKTSDVREPDWRQIDVHVDKIEDPVEGNEYGDSYPKDTTRLYYWRKHYLHREA